MTLAVVAASGARVDPGSLGLALARRWSESGEQALFIDADASGARLASRFGAAVQAEFSPALRGLPSLMAARRPLTLALLAEHCYSLDTFPRGCWKRWACGPVIGWRWRKARTASSCARSASTIRGSARCAPSCAGDAEPSTSKRSARNRMNRRFGIDTSILVRLVAGDPPAEFAHCVETLRALVEKDGAEIVASNQVIGETYVAVQHHYGVSKAAARRSLLDVLCSGLVKPLNGSEVLAALETRGGPGLFDRLIADEYSAAGLETLTLDRKMANLPGCRHLISDKPRRAADD